MFEINEAFASQVSSRDDVSLHAGSCSLQANTPASRGQHFVCESIYVCVNLIPFLLCATLWYSVAVRVQLQYLCNTAQIKYEVVASSKRFYMQEFTL